MTSAWDRQVGGTHYKDFIIQPSEYCQKNKLNHLESAIIKYATRHSSKGGALDLDKIIQCAEMIKELEYPEVDSTQIESDPFDVGPLDELWTDYDILKALNPEQMSFDSVKVGGTDYTGGRAS